MSFWDWLLAAWILMTRTTPRTTTLATMIRCMTMMIMRRIIDNSLFFVLKNV